MEKAKSFADIHDRNFRPYGQFNFRHMSKAKDDVFIYQHRNSWINIPLKPEVKPPPFKFKGQDDPPPGWKCSHR